MDVMTISSKFLRNIVSKIITKAIKKKLGQNCEIHINNVEINVEHDNIKMHLDVDGSISPKDLENLINSRIFPLL